MSNSIPDTEYSLYLWLKAYFIPDLQLCKNKRSRYDCYSERFNIDIELKCRRVHYDNLVIEKYKYDALVNRSNKQGTIPLYINSTPKGVYAFYLQSINIDWELRLMPKQTFFSDRDNVLKLVGFLDIETSVDLVDLKNKIKSE